MLFCSRRRRVLVFSLLFLRLAKFVRISLSPRSNPSPRRPEGKREAPPFPACLRRHGWLNAEAALSGMEESSPLLLCLLCNSRLFFLAVMIRNVTENLFKSRKSPQKSARRGVKAGGGFADSGIMCNRILSHGAGRRDGGSFPSHSGVPRSDRGRHPAEGGGDVCVQRRHLYVVQHLSWAKEGPPQSWHRIKDFMA